MKITAVKGFPVRCGRRNVFIVKVETDDGFYGLGEGGMSGRERAMQGMSDDFAQFLVGMDPRRIEHIWQTLYRGHYFEGGNNLAQLEYRPEIDHGYPRDLFPTCPVLGGDSFPLPTASGLGVRFNEEAATDYAFAYWEAPHWRRRDGARTNW